MVENMGTKVFASSLLVILLCSVGINGIYHIDAKAITEDRLFMSQDITKLKMINSAISAGSSAKTITPDLSRHDPQYLAGFDRGRKATGIYDDIWSRCCCLKIHETTVAIVSVDLIGVMYSEYQTILDLLPESVDIDLVVLSSTHNHEGPDVIGLWGPQLSTGINWEWYEETMVTIADTIVDAYESLVPAGLRFGHSEATGFSRDSRDPKITDDQVETIQAVDGNGTPIATMIFYGSHPEVLWDKNTLITSDYPHYIYEYIEAQVGGTAIFITGAVGGLITPKVQNHTFEGAKKFGESIAQLSLASIQNNSILWDTEIRTEFKEINVPLTNPLFRLASILGILNRPLTHLRMNVVSAVSTIELGNNGDIAQIVTVPGEDFPENWLELKEKLHAEHRILIGLGMDELGYIVRYEDFDWTEYEESMSASIWLDPIIHRTLEELLTL